MSDCLQCGRDCQGDDLFCSPVCDAGSAPAAEWHRLNDRVAELECEIAQARSRVSQLTAKCNQQQRDIMDLRTELARSTVE